MVGKTLWQDQGPSREIRNDWTWESVTKAIRPPKIIDYEALGGTSHDITVLATSTDGSTSSKTFNISVTDDVSDNNTNIGELSDSDALPNRVQENAAVGTSVGIIASAVDVDASDTVAYSLSDDAGGLFRIDQASGELTINGSLDYEAVGGTSHAVTVLATSSDGSTSTKIFNLSLMMFLTTIRTSVRVQA